MEAFPPAGFALESESPAITDLAADFAHDDATAGDAALAAALAREDAEIAGAGDNDEHNGHVGGGKTGAELRCEKEPGPNSLEGGEIVPTRSKGGAIIQIDASPKACDEYNLRAGWRVTTPVNRLATIAGVCNDRIWFQFDGDPGISYWREDHVWRQMVPIRDDATQKVVLAPVDENWNMATGDYIVKTVDFGTSLVSILLANETGPTALLAIANILAIRKRLYWTMAAVDNRLKIEKVIAEIAHELRRLLPRSPGHYEIEDAIVARLRKVFFAEDVSEIRYIVAQEDQDEEAAYALLAEKYPEHAALDMPRREAQKVAGQLDDLSPAELLRARVEAAIQVLPTLAQRLELNVQFDSVESFERHLPEVDIFELLGIPLVHGWVVDPIAEPEAAAVLCGRTHSKLVEALSDYMENDVENDVGRDGDNRSSLTKLTSSSDMHLPLGDAELKVARQWLDRNASQLTSTGLTRLRDFEHGVLSSAENHLGVLYRNEHFYVVRAQPRRTSVAAGSRKGMVLEDVGDARFASLLVDPQFERKKYAVWEEHLSPNDSRIVDSLFVEHDDAAREEAVSTAKLFGWSQWEVDDALRSLERPGETVDTGKLTEWLQRRFPLRDQL